MYLVLCADGGRRRRRQHRLASVQERRPVGRLHWRQHRQHWRRARAGGHSRGRWLQHVYEDQEVKNL